MQPVFSAAHDLGAVRGFALTVNTSQILVVVVAGSFAPDRLTFLYDFPASQAALARVHGEVAARFEAFWGPLELANGFHELGVATED